jgi:predicted component of type VI protein secretion system
VLDDASVSRRHAWVISTEYGCYVQDNDSSAGTAVNGRVLAKGETAKLNTGGRVSFGSVDLVFLPPTSFYSFVRTVARP